MLKKCKTFLERHVLAGNAGPRCSHEHSCLGQKKKKRKKEKKFPYIDTCTC